MLSFGSASGFDKVGLGIGWSCSALWFGVVVLRVVVWIGVVVLGVLVWIGVEVWRRTWRQVMVLVWRQD